MGYRKSLKIAYIDFDDLKNPLLGAGQARATYEVAKRLVKRGHEVTVYCSRYPGYQDRTEDGIKYIHFGINTKYIRINNLFYFFFIPFIVPRISADIIIESFTAPFSTLCSPLFTKTPVIGLPSMFNAKEFSKKYKIPCHWFEHWGSKCYKYFLPYSNVDSAKMVKLNPKIKYKITPQGVDESYFNIPHKESKHILFLSRLDIEQKGIDLLLKSYALVKDKLKIPLVIAGHGPDEQKIRKIIKNLNLESDVKLVGSAYGEKKNDLISNSLFVAFPSRHDELSLWSLEALASGMPLVSFDLPEHKWASQEVCLKAKPYCTAEYGQLMCLASQAETNKKMRIEARKFASSFSWDRVVDRFLEFMHEIIEEKKSKTLI
jgi:glycogen synthase